MEMLVQFLNKSIYILFIVCFIIIIFSLINRLYILWLYSRTLSIREPNPQNYYSKYPKVTVQLPIFNEAAVVARLINNICKLDYPKEALEIQVLDDSTDETRLIAADLCRQKFEEGINIQHIWREKREGFKAGALQYGLQTAKGEFVAIFDSDFLPPSDFLKKTIHFFTDEKIGWVQARWAHLNENFSLLTQCIALFCDSLFQVESSARSKLKHWGIFNGTAGLIRCKMIEDAGGWHWDTITEDSDLSYRALSRGWEYVTLADTTCPCELPPTLPAFIEQQTRWSKGNIQVVKKLLSKILSANVKFINKYDFISYLTNYLFFPAMTFFSIMIMPNILLNFSSTSSVSFSSAMMSLLQGLVATGVVYLVLFFFFKCGQKKQNKNVTYLTFRTFLFMFMSTGLAPFIALAIFEGFFKKEAIFIRTPKYDLTDKSRKLIKKAGASSKTRAIAKVGMGMGIYTFVSIFIGCHANLNMGLQFLPALTLFSCSYFYFGLLLAYPEQKMVGNIYEYNRENKSDLEKSFVV